MVKKIYDFMSQYQDAYPADPPPMVANLEQEIAWFEHWCDTQTDLPREPYIYGESAERRHKYCSVVHNLTGTDQADLEQWYQEPAYRNLVSQSVSVILSPAGIRARFSRAVQSRLPHDSIESLIVYVQQPGDICPIHLDHNIELLKKQVDHSIERYMIFLKPQMPGQFFWIAGHSIQWRQYDVLKWPGAFAHGSANAGYHPRPALFFTVRVKPTA